MPATAQPAPATAATLPPLAVEADADTDAIDPQHLLALLSPTTLSRSKRQLSYRDSVAYGAEILSAPPYVDEVKIDYSLLPSLRQSWVQLATRFKERIHVPYFPWWRNRQGYLRDGLGHDALTGLMCAVLVIPESLSYMLLSSLAPVVGLYTAAVAPFAYALLGTSPHVSVGPISLVSLFLPSIFHDFGFDLDSKTEEALRTRQEAASVLAFYVFVIFAAMSVLKLGGVVKFLSHDLMTGTSHTGRVDGRRCFNRLLLSHSRTHQPHHQKASSRPPVSSWPSRR